MYRQEAMQLPAMIIQVQPAKVERPIREHAYQRLRLRITTIAPVLPGHHILLQLAPVVAIAAVIIPAPLRPLRPTAAILRAVVDRPQVAVILPVAAVAVIHPAAVVAVIPPVVAEGKINL